MSRHAPISCRTVRLTAEGERAIGIPAVLEVREAVFEAGGACWLYRKVDGERFADRLTAHFQRASIAVDGSPGGVIFRHPPEPVHKFPLGEFSERRVGRGNDVGPHPVCGQPHTLDGSEGSR